MLGLFTLPFSSQSLRPNRLNRTQEYTLPYGRVTSAKIDGFARPSYSADLKQSFWEDLVLPITGVALGDEESGHNRVWYELNNESFVHSGDIQPVDIRPNPILDAIAPEGQLAEVTVPFTDAVWRLRQQEFIAYRLYYGTTHWVYGRVEDADGKVWYRIDDDKWKISYYVNAAHLHIVTADEITPLSPDVPQEEKRIEVVISNQTVTAYEGKDVVFQTNVSTGLPIKPDPNGIPWATPKGNFNISTKLPSQHMGEGNLTGDPDAYELPGVPWTVYFEPVTGVAFHGAYWHNNFGMQMSHGCVNMRPDEARWLFRWTTPAFPVPVLNKKMRDKRGRGTLVQVI